MPPIACIAACRTEHHRRVATLMRFTGLRLSQASELRWDDLDLERAILHVRPELGKMQAEQAGRYVPISAHLVAEIERWERGDDDGYLLRMPVVNGRRMHPRAREMANAWKRAGVPAARWKRPDHCFRHVVRTELTRAGALQDAIDYLVGHKGQGMRPVYTDPDAWPMREAVAKIPPVKGVLLALEGGRAG